MLEPPRQVRVSLVIRAILIGLILGVAVPLGVYFFVGGSIAVTQLEEGLGSVHDAIDSFRNSSGLARSIRCAISDDPRRPPIDTSHLQVSYSWTGGFGPGEVHLEVNEGRGTLTLTEWDSPPQVIHADIPISSVESVVRTAQEVGFFCLETARREKYWIVDLGRFEIAFESPSYEKTVFVDGMHHCIDGEAFFDVQQEILGWSAFFGASFDWGPYAISSVPIDEASMPQPAATAAERQMSGPHLD